MTWRVEHSTARRGREAAFTCSGSWSNLTLQIKTQERPVPLRHRAFLIFAGIGSKIDRKADRSSSAIRNSLEAVSTAGIVADVGMQ